MVVAPLSAWLWCSSWLVCVAVSVGVAYCLLVQRREKDDELCGWTEKKSREQKSKKEFLSFFALLLWPCPMSNSTDTTNLKNLQRLREGRKEFNRRIIRRTVTLLLCFLRMKAISTSCTCSILSFQFSRFFFLLLVALCLFRR